MKHCLFKNFLIGRNFFNTSYLESAMTDRQRKYISSPFSFYVSHENSKLLYNSALSRMLIENVNRNPSNPHLFASGST